MTVMGFPVTSQLEARAVVLPGDMWAHVWQLTHKSPSNISTIRKKAREKEDFPLPVRPQIPIWKQRSRSALWPWGMHGCGRSQHCDPGVCTGVGGHSIVTLGDAQVWEVTVLWPWGIGVFGDVGGHSTVALRCVLVWRSQHLLSSWFSEQLLFGQAGARVKLASYGGSEGALSGTQE